MGDSPHTDTDERAMPDALRDICKTLDRLRAECENLQGLITEAWREHEAGWEEAEEWRAMLAEARGERDQLTEMAKRLTNQRDIIRDTLADATPLVREVADRLAMSGFNDRDADTLRRALRLLEGQETSDDD